MTQLTVILISKNQAWNIVRLIESVLERTSSVTSREIILVDSASTDETVKLASQYPIRILRLSPNQRLTPAAGRYIGYKHTTGELVLFLDGDNELYPNWLEKALSIIESRPDVAAITGPRVPLPIMAGPEDKPPVVDIPPGVAAEAKHSGGTAMFRRSVLEEVGTFNPYLYSDEEPDLALRIRYAGYHILKTGHPIAYDYTDPADALSTKIARWRRNLYLGFGQNLRYHLGSEIFWSYLRERGFGLVPILGLLAGIMAFLWFLNSGQSIWLNLWLILIGLIIVGDTYRKRNFYKVMVSLLVRTLIADGTIRGFLIKPLPPDEYPGRYDVIK